MVLDKEAIFAKEGESEHACEMRHEQVTLTMRVKMRHFLRRSS